MVQELHSSGFKLLANGPELEAAETPDLDIVQAIATSSKVSMARFARVNDVQPSRASAARVLAAEIMGCAHRTTPTSDRPGRAHHRPELPQA